MGDSASEKSEILQLVEQSSQSVRQTLKRLAIHRSTYYNWLKRYYDGGVDALDFTGLDEVKVKHKPRLFSDNGPCYFSSDLAANGMTHSRGKPYHLQTQGKIERWHRSMKNQILLNNYYLPSELQAHIQRFVTYYNHERYHEALDNLTPADVYYDRGRQIREERELIKLNTLAQRRQLHYDRQLTTNQMSRTVSSIGQATVQLTLTTYITKVGPV